MATSSITDIIIVDSDKLQKALDEFDKEKFTMDWEPVNIQELLEAGKKLL
ncbi:hypothetical protein [Methanolapillus millepedarum]|uniref:Uncharacterized protein n=1 Tax=Methanolapillus millepedarum TaxID=3028296 RepID=A0AA96V577_9EURY|nr:hypothetical protein MsAc7_17130 [Methanosarcinaceae archaeon Ac7]